MEFLKNFFFQVQIPYFHIIKKALFYATPIPILLYFFTDIPFTQYGEWGWWLLIGVMLIRPIADVFPDFKILKTLISLRKELGILSGILIIVHAYGYFDSVGENMFTDIFKPEYWQWNQHFMWGILGFFVLIIILSTSNNFSTRLLKSYWKRIQRLSYLLFLFAGIHIALIKKGEFSEAILPVVLVAIFWLLAQLKIKIPILRKK